MLLKNENTCITWPIILVGPEIISLDFAMIENTEKQSSIVLGVWLIQTYQSHPAMILERISESELQINIESSNRSYKDCDFQLEN